MSDARKANHDRHEGERPAIAVLRVRAHAFLKIADGSDLFGASQSRKAPESAGYRVQVSGTLQKESKSQPRPSRTNASELCASPSVLSNSSALIAAAAILSMAE
ncbi:MAG: hypothetical protein WCB11_14390 [Terriglobales bacterium]